MLHRHVTLNGRITNIPSAELKIGDRVGWTDRARKTEFFTMVKQWQGGREVPAWLSVDPVALEGQVLALPSPDEIDARFNESAIVEYYSR